MNTFVTGGTGMTGAHLLLKLAEKGYNITALKRENSNIEIPRKIFNYHSDKGDELFSNINWITGDLSDYNILDEAMKNVDHVYHTAAMVSFKPADKHELIRNNVQGTANIVNASLMNRVKKLCHVSSVAALGETGKGEELTEDTEKTDYKNVSGYAVSKHRSEREVWRGIAEGLNAVIVNPSIILGAGNWCYGSPRMIKSVWDGLDYYTKGENGFIDVRDVVKTMILLTESDINEERFILSAENLSFRTVFNFTADNLNKKRASKYAGNFMLHTLKTFDKLRYYISNKEPRLTKHTLHSAQQIHTCSNKKIKEALDYEFIPIDKSIEDICKIFLREFNSN